MGMTKSRSKKMKKDVQTNERKNTDRKENAPPGVTQAGQTENHYKIGLVQL